MTAFVCVFDRRGKPVDAALLRRLAEPLADSGADITTFRRGPVGIVVRERAKRAGRARPSPLAESTGGLALAVCGRFHVADRDASPSPVTAAAPSEADCASWALSRWEREGAGLLSTVAGSFALIVADVAAGWLGIARDHLGESKVYYHLDDRWLVAASEPEAILRHDAVSGALDESAAARFLGFRFDADESSFFRDIRELLPARYLHVTAGAVRIEPYWRFRHLAPVVRRSSAAQLGAEYVARLEQALASRLGEFPAESVALSLSGGLDSTALAALAPRGVRAFSWRLAAIVDDEPARVAALSRSLGLPVRWVPGDGLEPLGEGFAERFVHGNSPYVNPFAALKARLYETARAEGCEAILVGDAGDAPYAAREYWLREALAHGRPWALRSLARTLGRAARGDGFARLALRRLVPVRGLRRALGASRLPWLTAEGNALLPREALSPILPATGNRHRHELAVGAKHTELLSEEQRLFERCSVERIDPFWHWPLLELAIAAPAYLYHRDGVDKPLAREALRGRLPKEILAGGRVGLLGRFFLSGIEARRETLRETVFRRPVSDWRRYVEGAWLEPYLEATATIAFGHTILWRVISYELWQRRLSG